MRLEPVGGSLAAGPPAPIDIQQPSLTGESLVIVPMQCMQKVGRLIPESCCGLRARGRMPCRKRAAVPAGQASESASAWPARHWQARTRAPGHRVQAPPQRRKRSLRLSRRLPSSRSESPPTVAQVRPSTSRAGRTAAGAGVAASEDALKLACYPSRPQVQRT